MNKREVVWLIVRLVGVYFAYWAIVTLFSLAGAGYALYSLTSPASGAQPDIANTGAQVPGFPRPQIEPNAPNRSDPTTEKIKSDAFKTVLLYLFLTGLYGGVGFYLIRRGGILFDILNNDKSPNRRESEPTVTTLKL